MADEVETEDDPMEMRLDGPTPNGGVSSVAYYSDGHGNRVPKSKAAAVEIHELDASGNSIFRTYASLKGRPKPSESDDEWS